MRYSAACVVALALTAPALAHEDTMFEIRSDGTLLGLPAQYTPAMLRWSSEPNPGLTLRVAARENVLPRCLTSKLSLGQAQIRAYGSWYHERSLLPPYIAVDVIHKQHKHGHFTGYTLLFNLDTSQLMELTRITGNVDEQQRTAIKVTPLCETPNEAR